MELARRRAPRARIWTRRWLLLLVLLAGAGCASGKWAWQLTEKEKRIDHVKAKEAPAVGRPSRCMEDLATILNCIAARNT